MAMQLMSLMPAKKSTINRESMGSMISGLVSINQKKTFNIKNSFRRLRSRLPSIATPVSRIGNQSNSNQSDDKPSACNFF